MSTFKQIAQADLQNTCMDEEMLQFRGWNGSLEDMRRFKIWVRDLSESQVEKFFHRAYYPMFLNSLSVFGEKLPVEKIRSLVAACTKSAAHDEVEFYNYLANILELANVARAESSSAAESGLSRIRAWDFDLLQRLLSLGKGLIVCTFRVGLGRILPVEMALRGFKCRMAVNTSASKFMRPAIESAKSRFVHNEAVGIEGTGGKPLPENIKLFDIINVEDQSGSLRFARALKMGEIISLFIEGNTGADGPWGKFSKSVIEFLNFSISVKNGVASFAASLGTPLLPVLALRDPNDNGHLVMGDPIIPQANLSGSERERFVQDTMQSLYRFLEPYVLKYPEQWSSVSALHRWRTPIQQDHDQGINSLTSEREKVIGLLQTGSTFKVNQQRVANFSSNEGMIWVDAKTLKSYKDSGGSINILQALSDTGLNQMWIDKQSCDPDEREKLLVLLARLSKCDLINVY